MLDPSTVYLDHAVTLAQDVVLEPNVVLRGKTSVGERTRIATGSQIFDSAIGGDCVVWASVIERSVVDDHVTIGPFSHLRPGTHVGARSEIGNFAELKNSNLGEHVRQHHNSYLGDADVGADTNVGAGTITANYDGAKKHRTTIGERVFLGVDTMIVAPVSLGDGSKTGAGAVVTKDVPSGKLAVGVPARIREPRAPAPSEPETPAGGRRSRAPGRRRGRHRVSGPIAAILLLLVLTALEAFFVAAEIALVSIRRSRVEQLVDEGKPGAKRVRRLLDDPGRFLAVSQLGLTFIGFLASAYAAVSLADGLAEALAGAGMDRSTANVVALLIVTVVLALFTIVFAELVPKSLALANNERFALVLSGPLDFLGRLLGPVVAALTGITRWVVRLFGAEVTVDAQITAEELRLIVERGGEQGILEAEEEQMINAVIELGDRRLHEVMVPRIAIVSLPASSSFDDALDTVIEQGHSRVPVYETSVDEVVGILYAKDLLPFLKSDVPERPDLRTLLRTPVFVPESMSIDDLLHEFQRRKVHIAIVLDEYGGTAGLVTIEDLLEEIVGEIQDEYDVEEPLVEQLGEDRARVDGRASVDDLLDLWDIKIPLEDDDEYDTVGGLVYHRIGGVPSPGDEVHLDGLRLTVETTDGRRVGKVLVVRERSVDDESSTDDD